MTITLNSTGTAVAVDGTSTGAMTAPSHTTGDVRILQVLAKGTSATTPTPSGWTLAGSIAKTTTHRLTVFYRVATSAADGNVTATQTVSGLIFARETVWRGCDTTTPLDVAPVISSEVKQASASCPSITPVSANAMAIWLFGKPDDNTIGSQTQGTLTYSSDTITGSDGNIALVYELQTSATATGVCTMTEGANGTDNWTLITLALRPLAVAAANPSHTLFSGLQVAVEVAFDDIPLAPSPTWTDIAAYVRDIDCTVFRGRNGEFTDTQPSQLTVALKNTDRRFDPDYSSGPYFGKLTPNKRIRVRARYNSTNYTIYDGFVWSWPQAYEPNSNSTVYLTAIDWFGMLSRRSTPPTDLAVDVMIDQPLSYWTFHTDEVISDLTGNGRDASLTNGDSIASFLPGEPERNCQTVTGEGGRVVIHFRNRYAPRAQIIQNARAIYQNGSVQYLPAEYTNTLVVVASYPVIARDPVVTERAFTAPAGDTINVLHTLEAWIMITHAEDSSSFLINASSANSSISFSASSASPTFGSYYFVEVDLQDFGAFNIYSTEVRIQLNTPYHFVGVLDETEAVFTIYVNGQVYTTTNTSSFVFDGGTTMTNGSVYVQSSGAITAQYAHIAIYDTELSAARVTAHYQSGITGGLMDTAATRMEKLADFAGLVDAGLYSTANFDDNTYLDRGQYGSSVLDEMQKIARSEQGRLYVSGDGVLTFQPRTVNWDGRLSRLTTSQGTFGDQSGELPYGDVVVEAATLDKMRNLVSVTVKAGNSAVIADRDLISTYGELPETVDTVLASPDDGQNLARARIRLYGDPNSRIPSMVIPARRNAASLLPVLLAMDLGNRYVVNRRPQGVGSAITKTVQLEGFEHRFSSDGWQTTAYYTLAHTTYTAGPYFIVGDATYGVVGTSAGNLILR